MSDAIPLSAREFAAFYGISRERLSRIINISLRDRGGIFGLAGLGYFRVDVVDAHRQQITPTTLTRAQQEANPPFALKGRLMDPAAVPDPNPPQAALASASRTSSDTPSKFELECRVLEERATALRQKNVLEQARLRDETVSYCSAAVQILLRNLRADIDAINLDPAASASLRAAIDSALADLAAVIPSIIAGQSVDRIELELSARRADRISGRVTPSASEAEPTTAVQDSSWSASEAEPTTAVQDLSSRTTAVQDSSWSASEAEPTTAVEGLSS